LREALRGTDAVIHLAAWHSAHHPRISDATIFAVNVDGTFNLIEACKEFGIKSLVFASSMAYGWHSVYAVTKVIGEDLCREFHEKTGASVAILRYNEFIPRPYLEFGAHLLTNGVDRRDVSSATLAALRAVTERRVELFKTIVHNNNHETMPERVLEDFRSFGPEWCEKEVTGSHRLLEKYAIPLPEGIENYDLSEAEQVLGWKPKIGFLDFLKDLKSRDDRGEDVSRLMVPSELHSNPK
jgi:nucleoside-diphosphate-sugar epimerase